MFEGVNPFEETNQGVQNPTLVLEEIQTADLNQREQFNYDLLYPESYFKENNVCEPYNGIDLISLLEESKDYHYPNLVETLAFSPGEIMGLEGLNKKRPMTNYAEDQVSEINCQKRNKKTSNLSNRLVYRDLIYNEDLSIEEKLVPSHLMPHKRSSAKSLLINGRAVITVKHMRRLVKNRLVKNPFEKCHFLNGEPVPANQITDKIFKNKALDGRKFITRAAFLKRGYQLVSDGRYLTLEEKKHIVFNPSDKKCYLNDMQVMWFTKRESCKGDVEQFSLRSEGSLDQFNPLDSSSFPNDTSSDETPPCLDQEQRLNTYTPAHIFTRPGISLFIEHNEFVEKNVSIIERYLTKIDTLVSSTKTKKIKSNNFGFFSSSIENKRESEEITQPKL